MRTAVLIAVTALALGGCDATQNPFAKKDAKPAPAPAPIQAAAAPAPVAPPPPQAPDADLNAIPPAARAEAPPAAAAPQIVRWSPDDYARRERRIAALIANAEIRDGSGETQHVAEEGRFRRAHCTTKACIESAYADEEAWLRQWEGAAEVK